MEAYILAAIKFAIDVIGYIAKAVEERNMTSEQIKAKYGVVITAANNWFGAWNNIIKDRDQRYDEIMGVGVPTISEDMKVTLVSCMKELATNLKKLNSLAGIGIDETIKDEGHGG